jgi:gluconokinase
VAQALTLVVCGVSGAGKTTIGQMLAARLACTFLDADDFHPPANVAKMARGEPLADADREPWLDAIGQELEQRMAAGERVVLACSALRQAHRQRLGVDQKRVMTVFLDGSQSLIASRIATRAHAFMPASLLQSQFDALEPPADGIRVEIDADPATICERIIEMLANR